MQIAFKTAALKNFKSQKDFSIKFGEVTKISGRNGAGKSSAGEAITWLLYGVDMMGNKFDPTPLTAETEDIVEVELLLDIDGDQLLLKKQLVKGKAKYFVNEVPEPAKKFDEVVNKLGDKNLVLSIFNPVYFPAQHWKDQRAQLLQYVPEPFKQEILAEISKAGQEALEEKLKKHDLEQLVKIYSPKHKEGSRSLDRAGERVLTLKEQYELALGRFDEGQDEEHIKQQIAEKEDQMQGIKKHNNEAQEAADNRKQREYMLRDQRSKMDQLKKKVESIQAEPIKDNCQTCKQPLKEDAVNAVKENKQQRIKDIMQEGGQLAAEYKKLFAEWEQLPEPPAELNQADLQAEIYELKNKLDARERVSELEAAIEKAEADKQRVRSEYLEAQAVLDAAKEYETAKSELMVKKVSGLFDRLTVSLFKKHKNGNQEPAFEIEYQGKPYAKLSTAERIKAGLELVEVLITQSKTSVPVFIDNAESIITFKQPNAQLITATVKNSHLVVKQEGAE
jgi:hypothetical protein